MLLPEKVVQGRLDFFRLIDLARFQTVDQVLRRQVDIHHLVGHRQHAVRNPFVNLHTGNLLNLFIEAFDMLDVDCGNDADPRIENLHHVLPPLGIFASFDVGVGQFVNDDDLRMQVDDRLRVHLFKLLALVKEPAPGNERKPHYEGFRFRTAMRLNISDTHIDTCVEQLVRLLQHAVSLAHAGTHADIDLELAAMRLLDQIEKVLGAPPGVMGIHTATF